MAESPEQHPPHPEHPLARPTRSIAFEYAGVGSELFGILFMNSLLTIVTLGFYHPWGHVRQLRFMIGSIKADGDAFTFHGNGRELLMGMLRVWLLFFLPLFLLGFVISMTTEDSGLQLLLVVAFYGLALVFVPFALIGSLRYRTSRSTWRGIRFGFDGTFGEFGAGYIARLLLVGVTLGIAYPFVACWRREYVLTHSRFGSQRFEFDGNAGELFGRYLLCWFLFVPTLGTSMVWYHGHQQAYFWNHTRLAGTPFRSTLTGGEWLWISFMNLVLAMVTLGIAAPWIYVNQHRAFFKHLSLDPVNLALFRQGDSQGSGVGEAAADMLHMDGGVDIG